MPIFDQIPQIMFKKVLWVTVTLLFLLVVLFFIFSSKSKPQYDGNISFKGVSSQVEVYFDEHGVPHIYSDSEADAFKVLGYVHAQDRLWQMELVRRIAAGRLSEIFGAELLGTDKFFRALGVEYASAKTIEKLDKKSAAYLLSMAYLDGVNQFIEEGNTPIEFTLLGIDKEKYDLNDMYNVFGYMAFGFAQAHKTDPLLTHLKDKLGSAYLTDLAIDIDPASTFIKNARPKTALSANMVGSIETVLAPSPVPPFIGSNSWVLGPDKTKNKKVIFANDPHIGYSQPSVWYQAHVVTPDYEMYGFHLALTPFPVLGHNRQFAYGMTMLENDDLDFYYESDASKFKEREEVIHVKGEEDVIFTVREGPRGPIISDLLRGLNKKAPITVLDKETPVSMDWIYTKKDNRLLQATYSMSHSQNLAQFRRSCAQLHAPGLNIMYGDAKGNIAWFGAAKLYEHAEGVNSKFILDGTDKTQSELEFLEFNKNPQAINPRWDYVYSANNQPQEVNGKMYPGYYLPEDRAKRIVDLIEAKDVFSVEDVMAMTYDVTSSQAAELMKTVLKNVSMVKMNDLEKEAIDSLQNWDGGIRSDQVQPTIYFNFIYNYLSNTFQDEMGKEVFDQFLKTHLYKRQIAKQIGKAKSIWWDDIETEEVNENREEILTRSFHETIAALENQFGDDIEDWSWKNAATAIHKHAFDKSSLLRGFFNVGPFVTHGGNEVINNQLFDLNGTGTFEIKAGPSTRRVIDFSDIENGMAILPTGQSGNIFSKHYKDQSQKFLKGEFVKMMLNEKEIRESKDKLIFTPDE